MLDRSAIKKSNNPYSLLLEPIKIGPVTAPNRFYQTPFTSGAGFWRPKTRTAFREVRAEGGWGVVNTGYCSIHPSSDPTPMPYSRLWSDQDVAEMAQMVDAIHKHGSLAGVELWHGGEKTRNRYTREASLSPSGLMHVTNDLRQLHSFASREMRREDIRQLLSWQKAAAKRAVMAGFDIVYVYAGMGFLPFQFLLDRMNTRTDEYGGTLENRTRLLREMLEVTKEAVEGRCAVALRFSVDEGMGSEGFQADTDAREVVRLLSDLPDLWDVKLGGHGFNDCPSSRFMETGYQEDFVKIVKQETNRPVVGVGWFTSPDTMVSQIRRGVIDLVGAARATIADPFLPKKVLEGNTEDIRECIGCNICFSTWVEGTPVRCTQNPTAGEEWRQGWHPERIKPSVSDSTVLIVGGGPAGLEAAVWLGKRGYSVTLAEAGKELGGRAALESRLPGLSSWSRIVDWRIGQLHKLPNVEIYLDSTLSADQIQDFGFAHVALATGALWDTLLPGSNGITDLIPPAMTVPVNDILHGALPQGRIAIYDFDCYYLGSVIAELFLRAGRDVEFITPASEISPWARTNNDHYLVQKRLISLGLQTAFNHSVILKNDTYLLKETYSGKERALDCDAFVVVGRRTVPNTGRTMLEQLQDSKVLKSVTAIGDCDTPGMIAHAIYSGRKFAETFDGGADSTNRFEPWTS